MSVSLPFGQPPRSASILVVDDEPDVADLFRQHFRREARRGTYVMQFAASGVGALDRLSGEIRPALVAVLSDINMPGMDGLQLLHLIKKPFPDLPVMMVTAYGDEEPAVVPPSMRFSWNINWVFARFADRDRWGRGGFATRMMPSV